MSELSKSTKEAIGLYIFYASKIERHEADTVVGRTRKDFFFFFLKHEHHSIYFKGTEHLKAYCVRRVENIGIKLQINIFPVEGFQERRFSKKKKERK